MPRHTTHPAAFAAAADVHAQTIADLVADSGVTAKDLAREPEARWGGSPHASDFLSRLAADRVYLPI